MLHYYKHYSDENTGMTCYWCSHYPNICYNLQNFLPWTYYWIKNMHPSLGHRMHCSHISVVYSVRSGRCLMAVLWAYCELTHSSSQHFLWGSFFLPGPQHYLVSLLNYFTFSVSSDCQQLPPPFSLTNAFLIISLIKEK